MTIAQQKKIMKKIVGLENDIEALKAARLEIATKGYASATMSSGGGSKSYTRLDLDKISHMISELVKELTEWRNLLVTGNPRQIKTMVTVYV